MKMETTSAWRISDQKMYILYCTIAGLISVWAISGLLVMVDYISGTPTGTFFAVIGISLGINDPTVAQYVGFVLHLLTGTIAGNVYGQVAIFWRKMAPVDYKRGIMTGLVTGFVSCFQGMYGLIIGAYGALLGWLVLAGRMNEMRVFLNRENCVILQ